MPQQESEELPADLLESRGDRMRKLLTSMRIALRALRVNSMRSMLTMLGIIIGVAAVIAMVGVGSGRHGIGFRSRSLALAAT